MVLRITSKCDHNLSNFQSTFVQFSTNSFLIFMFLISIFNFLSHKALLWWVKSRGQIFSHVRPFYERAVSNLDRSMHRSLWVYVAHSLFIEGLHMTKNMASELLSLWNKLLLVSPCKKSLFMLATKSWWKMTTIFHWLLAIHEGF